MPQADRFETKEFRDYKRKLSALASDVLPRVVAETINIVAGFAHAESVRNIRKRFVNRNAYTERSARYYQAKPRKNWMEINAISGSISDYMDEQDAGGFRLPKQGSRAPVATLAARGGSSTKTVRKQYQAGSLGKNQFVGTPRGGNRPYGVYARNRKNTQLVMIRNISRTKVKIEGKHWHTDAVEFRYRREVLTAEFVRQAKIELAKLGAT